MDEQRAPTEQDGRRGQGGSSGFWPATQAQTAAAARSPQQCYCAEAGDRPEGKKPDADLAKREHFEDRGISRLLLHRSLHGT